MASQTAAQAFPRILYVVSEDWYFLSHRLPMARAARDAGFEVHVATKVANGAGAIAAEKFHLHSVPFSRGQISPFAALSTIAALRRLYRDVKPDIAHHVALQPCLLGSIAALGRPIECINAITGLGYVFTSSSLKARVLRAVIGRLIRLLIGRERSTALVQNPDDRALLIELGIAPERIVLIPGSGVDVDRLKLLPEPPEPLKIGFVGRLLIDKGIRTTVDAYRLLRRRGMNIQLLIAGTCDNANPASVPEAEAESWSREPGIDMLGHVEDVATVWAHAHIAVLPSRREGLPKALLEAAMCGRPLVATDVPGCREIVIPGETGLLVPADDAGPLADAIERLASNSDLRANFGAAARRLAVERFSADVIGRQIVDLYRQRLSARS